MLLQKKNQFLGHLTHKIEKIFCLVSIKISLREQPLNKICWLAKKLGGTPHHLTALNKVLLRNKV